MCATAVDTIDIKALRPLELYYFRIARERWELMLARARQMGADALSTSLPWSWHEPRDGVFDLSGITHPARDVSDFLETCRGMGFPVLLQVSPNVGVGLLGGGVPGWLLHEHLEICALGPDTQPRHDPACGGLLPCAEHPTYLKYVERWYRELSTALAGRQWPEGPIVALRVDRPDPADRQSPGGQIPSHWDYNPHVVKVQWPIWLRQQYDGIEALNAAWKTAYHSFSDVAFPDRPVAGEGPRPWADAADFVAYATTHAVETYARLLRDMDWSVPVVTDRNVVPTATQPTHIAQVDPESPQLGTGLRWAMDAPLRVDGSPRPSFWAVKAALMGMDQGVKRFRGGVLVSGAESRRLRLPRPAGNYGIYRLLLDGQLLNIPRRGRGDTLSLDYVAADEAGETDMYIFVNNSSAALPGLLREYLAWLLMSRAGALQRAGAMCQLLVEAYSGMGMSPSAAREEAQLSNEDLQAAEQGLAEARQAVRRAAASLGRLERLASQVRGELPAAVPSLPDLTAFSPQELQRLEPVRTACAQVAPGLAEAARSIKVLCQTGEARGEGLTINLYCTTFEGARSASAEAEAALAEALGQLRARLAAGALPPLAWVLQDWLTRILQILSPQA